MSQIEGRNPVLEALRTNTEINKILVQRNAGGSMHLIFEGAKRQGVVIVETEKATLDKLSEGRPHQGVIAQISVEEYAELDDIIATARASAVPLLVVLDHIEDPHNLGAIIRSALAAGAHGVVIPKRRSAALSPSVAKASAGAASHLPVARVPNLTQCVKELKEEGFWVIGAEAGGKSLYESKFTGPLALVVGSEGEGIGRLLKENCDEIITIPMQGPVNSLNASVAAGVVLFEIVRQRGLTK
ncbi:MAG: 23S rRNA (guanosine2251-2'-O)-methyltransferase [Bacillota bacterium]|nr:MAG: 23S rRNA (guanosine2251-2'-O)-methyltransferase [Bacillota bacterium]MBS3950589.1 23S rRNA (guanosine(2251)-2'-O)-methyltransferase RlmB [Peptococcaceae bacterium]